MTTTSLTGALRETLALFDAAGAPQTTTEVAEQLDLGRRSTYERLERLVEHGRLETKKVGGSGRVWWRPSPTTTGGTPDWPATAQSLIDDVLDGAEVGVFVLDEDFEVTWINEATERYFDLERERVLGRDKRRLVEERIAPLVDDEEAFTETVLATYDNNTYTEQFECRVTPGGEREERWLEHRSKPIESGTYAGGRVELYYDVTECKRSKHARWEDRTKFESPVAAVEEYAIFMLDPDGYVRTWNRGAERIKGYDADDIVGQHFSTFYTDEDRDAGVPEENLVAASKDGSVEDEGWRIRADGSRFWANVTITAIRGENGGLDGFVKVTRDMTERRANEQALKRERNLLEEVQEAIPIGIGIFDADGDLWRANQRFTELLGRDDAGSSDYSLGQQPLFDADGDVIPYPERPASRALSTGEPIVDQRVRIGGPDDGMRWLSVNAQPLDGGTDGVVVTMTDVTQLEKQAGRLERQRDELKSELEEVFDRVDDAFYALDEEFRFEYVNDRAEAYLGKSEGELLGRNTWEALDVDEDDPIVETFETAMATQDPTSFERYSDHLGIWMEVRVYPSGDGLSVYFQDITERKQRERELKQYETIVETIDDGVYIVDEESQFKLVNEAHTRLTGYDREELIGAHASLVTDDEYVELAENTRDRLRADDLPATTVETELVTKEGERVPVETRVSLLELGTDRYGRVGVVRDITERKERERALREAKAQLEAATEASEVATWEWHIPEDRFVAGPSFAKTFGIDPDVAREGVSIDRVLPAIHEDDRDRIERRIEAAIASCGEYEEEYRVRNDAGELRWVVARGRVECDDAGDPVSFPGALTDITERKHAEIQLERQRERLTALNNLNDVVRDITDAVIGQSIREEIEAAVCERLAESDSYEFAWIAEVDLPTQSITPRIEAGVEGYLEEIPLSVDPDGPAGRGPAGRAVRTKEMQVTEDAQTDSDFAPWREYAETYGYRSAAAIPIVHDGSLYGLIGVYADRPNAFGGEEGEVIGQLGEVVGHAIAAAERKRALTSDEVVELEFRIRDVFDTLGIDHPTTGPITLDHAVPIEDEEFLVYGTAPPDAVDSVSALVEAVPHWKELTVQTADGTASFELRLSEPPVLSTVASLGGSVEKAVIEDGDYRMTIHLAPGADVSHVIDTVEAAYPTVDLLKRRQIMRHDDTAVDIQNVLTEDLTDRQQATLEAAVHTGYFAWPRDATGEEVAESLDIAPPTFHNHLRKAQRKVFESLFATPSPA